MMLKIGKKRIKPMPIVPETMGASKLMNLFIQKKKNIAVVVDEFEEQQELLPLKILWKKFLEK
jgi:CBS domain containing-hemolysin-like protein